MMGISVIIPVKGRIAYLEKLLESIAEARNYTSNPIEIIVVDDSSKETKPEVEALCKKFQAEYHYLQKGASEKRNYGIKIAKFSVIFFTDSDCEVEHDVFNEHLRCYNSEEIGGCAGLTEFVGKKTWLWNVIEKMPFLYPFQWAKLKSYVPWAPCTNISFRKDVIQRVNGFRSMLLPKESGEDVDLGYRITSLGYKICCNPNAKVYHTLETWGNLSQFIERTFRFGKGEHYLMKNHPENTFFDVPKVPLIFLILVILFTYKAVINNSLLHVIIPFVWLPLVILLQSILALKYRIIKGNGRHIIYIYAFLLFEAIFELSTIIECVKKRELKFIFRKFIYIEDQLFSRWHWGVIKMWSIIISFFILFVLLLIIG